MTCPVKIFIALWLIAGFYFIGKSQDSNEDIFEQRLGQATGLIGQTGDSLRVLLAEMSEGAVLTDLQEAKIDQIRLKLNTLEDILKVLSPAELIPTDTNRFPGSGMNDAQRLITQSRPDEGIPLIMEFLDRADSHSDSAVYAKIFLAEAYRQKQEHDKGIGIIYEILRKPDISVANRAFALNRMAALQNENRNFAGNRADSVSKYSRLCIDISQKHNLTEYLALSQNELGSFFMHQKMPDSALILFSEAVSNFLSINKYPQAINTYLNLSRLYLQTRQPEESEKILQMALKLGNIEENRNLFMYAYYNLANINFRSGDYADAYEYLHISYDLMSRFFADRMQRQINEMSAKYDLREKEAKIREESQKNKTYRIQIKYLTVISLIIICLLILLVLMSRLKNRAYKKLAEQNLKAIKKEKQVEQCLRNLTETDIMNRVGATDRHALTYGAMLD